MLLLATLGLCAALLLSVFLWRRLANQRIRRSFEALCKRFTLMGHFAKRVGPFVHPVALGTLRGRLTRIESASTATGRVGRSVTRFTVTRAEDDYLHLAVRLNPSGRLTGERYLVSGDDAFDAKLLVRTNDEERTRAVLDDQLRASLLAGAKLGMSPPGIQAVGDSIAYTEDGLLNSDRKRRLAEAMVTAMQDLADRLDETRPA